MNGKILVDAINDAWASRQEDGRRGHLGGSLIGRKCERELWYSFRWATKPEHNGRSLRLFDRGHREEYRFVNFLEDIGCEVRAFSERLVYHEGSDSYSVTPWEEALPPDVNDVSNIEAHIGAALLKGVKLGQFRIKDGNGHFGGSLDGKVRYVPFMDEFEISRDTWGLAEFKTHGEKSFSKLAGKRKWNFALRDFERIGGEGVKLAKPEHWAQMQTYMFKEKLPYAIYMAVCKDTDELHIEIILAEQLAGAGLIAKGRDIIGMDKPPERLNSSPSWYECKFCDFHAQCHFAKEFTKSCRTCVNSKPVLEGQWYCSKYKDNIPFDFQRQGCGAYQPVKD